MMRNREISRKMEISGKMETMGIYNSGIFIST